MIKWQHKLISILFAVLIIVSSTGILLIHHHCSHCGAEDWHLFSAIHCSPDSHNSVCCSSTEKSTHEKEIAENTECCKYEEFYFKLGTFISVVEFLFSHDFNFIIDYNGNINLFKLFAQTDNPNFYTDNSPPGIKENIYILYRSFRS